MRRNVLERYRFDSNHPKTPAEIAASLANLLSDFTEKSFRPGGQVIDQWLQPWLDSFLNSNANTQLVLLREALQGWGFTISWVLDSTSRKLLSLTFKQLLR